MLYCIRDYYYNHRANGPSVVKGTIFRQYIEESDTHWMILDVPDRLRGQRFPKSNFAAMSERMYRILYE